MLVIAINIAGAIYGDEAAQGAVQTYLSNYIDPGSAAAIESLVQSAGEMRGAFVTRIISIVVLVFGVLGAFVHVRTSLCLIWKLDPPHPNTIVATLLDYLLALVMVLVTGVLLIVSVAASFAVSFFRRHFPGESTPWDALEFLLSLVLLAVLFAAIYRILSHQRIAWRYVGYGSVIAALLFTVGKFLLGWYVAYAGIATTYGAAGGAGGVPGVGLLLVANAVLRRGADSGAAHAGGVAGAMTDTAAAGPRGVKNAAARRLHPCKEAVPCS